MGRSHTSQAQQYRAGNIGARGKQGGSFAVRSSDPAVCKENADLFSTLRKTADIDPPFLASASLPRRGHRLQLGPQIQRKIRRGFVSFLAPQDARYFARLSLTIAQVSSLSCAQADWKLESRNTGNLF